MGRGRNEKPRRLAGAFLGREGDYTLNSDCDCKSLNEQFTMLLH